MNIQDIGLINPLPKMDIDGLKESLLIKDVIWTTTLTPVKGSPEGTIEIFAHSPHLYTEERAQEVLTECMEKIGSLEPNEVLHVIMGNNEMLGAFIKVMETPGNMRIRNFLFNKNIPRVITDWIFIKLGWIDFVEAGGKLIIERELKFAEDILMLYNLSYSDGTYILYGKNKLH